MTHLTQLAKVSDSKKYWVYNFESETWCHFFGFHLTSAILATYIFSNSTLFDKKYTEKSRVTQLCSEIA